MAQTPTRHIRLDSSFLPRQRWHALKQFKTENDTALVKRLLMKAFAMPTLELNACRGSAGLLPRSVPLHIDAILQFAGETLQHGTQSATLHEMSGVAQRK